MSPRTTARCNASFESYQSRNDYERKLSAPLSDTERAADAEREIQFYQHELTLPDWQLLPDPQKARTSARLLILHHQAELAFWRGQQPTHAPEKSNEPAFKQGQPADDCPKPREPSREFAL